MQSTDAAEYTPGDRYPVVLSAEHVGVVHGSSGDDDVRKKVLAQRVIAVAPYAFTFCAPVKGRWVGLPLLTVFAREFAYLPPLDGAESVPQPSLDPCVTIPAYIEELRTGLLWLRGREAECRAAGSAYCDDLHRLYTSSPHGVALALLPQRLLLRQKDVILHNVLRREAPIPCDDPLHILRYDHVSRGSPPRRLLFLRKPHGVPVHPSGLFRKNSVTSTLEDIFGGTDAHRFCAVPLKNEGGENWPAESTLSQQVADSVECVAICHKKYGFEIIRVWVGDGYVSREAWAELQSMLEGRHAHKLKVFVVHRLDTPTSGVLLFGIDSASARITTEVLSQKGDGGCDCGAIESAATVGCSKQYLARVCGRFDVMKLAREQHHCSYENQNGCVIFRPNCTETAGDFTNDICWLRVDRPIGCLSYHESIYWCPDAALTESWLRDERNKEEERKESSACAAVLQEGRQKQKRAAQCDISALTAKRERMRKLTIGGRAGLERQEEIVIESAGEDGSALRRDGAVKDQAGRLNKETMRRAITLVRLVAYDAECDESVVECRLLTGRTHQVRVHLASLGHPIKNDKKYILQAAVAKSLSLTVDMKPGGDFVSLLDETMTRKKTEEATAERRNEGEEQPQRISLHAWRYTICYAVGETPELFEASPPAWVSIKTQTQCETVTRE